MFNHRPTRWIGEGGEEGINLVSHMAKYHGASRRVKILSYLAN